MDRIEIKADLKVDESGAISGIAWPFGSPDMVGDLIEKGAFNSPSRLPMLFAHDQGQAVGVWDSIAEDQKGLQVRGRLLVNDVERAKEVRALVREGAVTGLSIGFVTRKSAPRSGGGRTITQLDLREISIVPVPSHPGARVQTVKGKNMSTKLKTKADETEEDPAEATIEDRVSALETDVATLKEDVAAIKGTTEEASKALGRIEIKMNRPGGGPVDPKEAAKIERKALATLLRTGSAEEIKAAGTIETKVSASDNDPAGGYFVLPTVDLSIRTLITDLSPLRGLAEVVTISSDKYERFYSLGKRGAQRVSERDDRPQDTARPELIKQSYGVGEYYAAPAATRHLLDDAAVDIASWLINNATHDFAETQGEDFLRYPGTEGFPTGLLTYGTTNEKDFVRAWGKHQYIPAGHASAPTDANLVTACIKIVAALRKPYKGNATWLMNSTTATRLQAIVDENGRRLWAPTGNLIEGVEHPLLGYPVEIDEGMDDIGAGNHPIAFGDFKQGYVIVDREGIRITRDEVTQKGRVLFDTYTRVGGGAGDFNAIKFIKISAN